MQNDATDVKVQFGKTIRELREQKGISQDSLAQRSNLGRRTVFEIENGRRNVTLENINKLAWALGVNVSEIFIRLDHINDKDVVVSNESNKPQDFELLKTSVDELRKSLDNLEYYIDSMI